jgi:hypothetical protein
MKLEIVMEIVLMNAIILVFIYLFNGSFIFLLVENAKCIFDKCLSYSQQGYYYYYFNKKNILFLDCPLDKCTSGEGKCSSIGFCVFVLFYFF